MRTLMGRKIRTGSRKAIIVEAMALAFAAMVLISGIAYATSMQYYVISNPVWCEYLDAQGGAWDSYLGYNGLDLLSGNWRANLRIGSYQAWIDGNYFPSQTTVASSSRIDSKLVNTYPNPYGLSAGFITINMDANMVNSVTWLALRDGSHIVSEPWVMIQNYTIKNTGPATLNNMSFFMYYFPSPYGQYPTNSLPSHVDYVETVLDPLGFTYDITLYGEGTAAKWAYTGLSTSVKPFAHDVGHGGGYPDPPYFSPTASRPSANPTDVLREVENDNMRNSPFYDASSGGAVAGAVEFDIGSLSPGASWNINVCQAVAMLHAFTTSYEVTIDAYCITEAAHVPVHISMDGVNTGFQTSHTFSGLTGIHTFTVDDADGQGHPFIRWDTLWPSTTITVGSSGTFTAYYQGRNVGGIAIPVDKLSLLGILLAQYISYIGLFSAAIAATAITTAICFKSLKRRKEKQ
jgi:hypothetical protein